MANIKEARQFVKDWTGRGDEKQDTTKFWIQLLDKVYEDHDYNDHILFEQTADKMEGGKYFKDVIINRYTDHAVLIEQKGMKYALDQKEPRHGLMLTPFEQAKEYDDKSGANDKARWIITCNFQEFWIYDNYKTGKALYTPVAKLKLMDLPKHLDWLSMIVSANSNTHDFTEEVEVSTKAGELVGILYDDLHKNYADPDSEETLRQLNILCVRIVFCLYAEDAGLFDKNNRKMFHDYLAQFDAQHMRRGLSALFRVLDQKPEQRDKYLADDDPLLASFPYVNGGLFKGDVEIPPFTPDTVDILLNKESLGFDWSKISPTIFGAVFESTLNQETRRKGGMHYTSLENIHKVIDPLFLDELTKELNDILALKTPNIRNRRLTEYQNKLSQIKCFDPACGSGNFLTESYLSLRRLENKALKAQLGNNIAFGFEGSDLDPIQVSIQQFYGIEINDFAVSVAKTALWIAEAQMFEETQTILNSNKDFLPLETFTNIHEGNALKMDWNTVIDRRTEHLYIMGNPPFVGASFCSAQQKKEIVDIVGKIKLSNSLDYVAGWYYKAAELIQGTNIKCAFVSTNSITQGEQVEPMWSGLLHKYGIHIIFAYRTFIWNSEANDKAHVHCVIIGFSADQTNESKVIFNDAGMKTECNNINPYLLDAPDVLISSRSKPLCNVPPMTKGNQPSDGGNLILNENERNGLIRNDSSIEKFVHRYVGAKDYLNNNEVRYCLWLKDADPSEYMHNKEIMRRINAVKEMREKSSAAPTRKSAEWPYRFFSTPQTDDTYIIIPRVSSERRKYIPMGFMPPEVIAADSLSIICGASIYHFGILSSSVHMAWMKTVAGRLEMRYRYSGSIVYNNFPWPAVSEEQQTKIESTAKQILDARKKYPKSNLADMYDPNNAWAYPELVKAHQANDAAVMEAYGFSDDMTESEIVASLMKMYQGLISDKSGE